MHVPTNTKAVVWDLDGTLIDSFSLFNEILQDILPRRGIPVPPEELVHVNYHGTLTHTLQGILPNVGVALIDELVADFSRVQGPHYEHMAGHMYDDALDLAVRIHAAGMLQLVVSNRDHEGRGNASPRSIISKPPLSGIIEIAVCGDDNAFHKPDKRLLDDVMHKHNLVPTDILVIGDQYVDAHFAMNMGTNSVLVNRHPVDIPHLERLGDDLSNHVTIVDDLKSISV